MAEWQGHTGEEHVEWKVFSQPSPEAVTCHTVKIRNTIKMPLTSPYTLLFLPPTLLEQLGCLPCSLQTATVCKLLFFYFF